MGSAVVIADGLAATAGCQFNPADERIYYVDTGGRLLSFDRAGAPLTLCDSLIGATDITIADDWSTAFVATRDGSLYRINLFDQDPSPELVATDLGETSQIAWVPGRAAVWVVQTGIYGLLLEVDPLSGSVSQLSDVLDRAVGLAPRADGSAAFVSRPGEIVLIDVQGGGFVTPFASAVDRPGRLAWMDSSETTLVHGEPGTDSRVTQIDSVGSSASLLDTGDVQPAAIGMAWDQVLVGGIREVVLYDLNPVAPGPQVTQLSPTIGHGGDVLVVSGSGFGDWATPISVDVGGIPATVLEHADNRLRVLTHPETVDGSVTVAVGGVSMDAGGFTLNESPGYFDDGPPVVITAPSPAPGAGEQGIPKSGGAVFVALVTPADLAAPPASARTTIDDRWNGAGGSVATYYRQASFSKASVSGTVAAGWKTLSGNLSDYHWTTEYKQKVDSSGKPVFDANGHAVLETDTAGNPVPQTYPDGTIKVQNNFWNNARLAAEAVKLYKSEIAAANPDMIAITCYTAGAPTRAWGNMSEKTFAYSAAGLSISETLAKDTAYITVNEDADWGRLAHETGHNIIDPEITSALLREDIYSSDLIDPTEASAEAYDIMGDHDFYHALFSGFNLENLGWLNDPHASKPNEQNFSGQTNIARVKWDRNPRVHEFELQAHGTTENSLQNRHHVLKIIITPALAYFVEVRQRPGTTGLVFDPQLPDGGAPNQGGVVVTRALLDTVNNNQQTRFITLAHGPTVLRTGDTVVDPLRDLKITVIDDNVQAWPLICKVKVEWAQALPDDPLGKFDLRIDPWDGNHQTPDIWVDRAQDSVFDQPMDAEGRPLGSGDKPLVNGKNDLYCRIHNDGVDSASDVQVTFYSITPPGVGDNGNWTPMKTVTVASIAAGSSFDASTIWVPEVGAHTCLQVAASHQFGELTGGNNRAQENIFEFDLSAGSPVHPLTLPVAVRNPSPERQRIYLRPVITGETEGYVVQVPHQWVWVDGHGERMIDLIVAAPDGVGTYVEQPPIDVHLDGYLEHRYDETTGSSPAEFLSPIGGLTARCKAKPPCEVRIEAGFDGDTVWIGGIVDPGGSDIPVSLVLAGGPQGDVVAQEVVTGAGGAFSGEFALRDVTDRHPEVAGLEVDVIAVVDRAPYVAGGRSNAVRIRP